MNSAMSPDLERQLDRQVSLSNHDIIKTDTNAIQDDSRQDDSVSCGLLVLLTNVIN